MDENIVVNVDFEGDENRNDAVFNNSIQVVPANIAWEDFELMVCDIVNIWDQVKRGARSVKTPLKTWVEGGDLMRSSEIFAERRLVTLYLHLSQHLNVIRNAVHNVLY